MSAIFKNRYITRLVVDSRKGLDSPQQANHIHVALGVFTPLPLPGAIRQPLMPTFFGIPMKYEMGDVHLYRVTSVGVDMHLIAGFVDKLDQASVYALADGGLITRLGKGIVQLLEQGKGK